MQHHSVGLLHHPDRDAPLVPQPRLSREVNATWTDGLAGSRYTITHGIGVAFALGGLFTLVLIDFSKAEEAGVGNGSVILGDSLTIIAASLYGVSNVLQVFVAGQEVVYL